MDYKNYKNKKENYNDYVKSVTPTTSTTKNVFLAFVIGGLICMFGEFLIHLYEYFGCDNEVAKSYETFTLILLAVILTGFNIYKKLAKFAGAGSLVPITGFANSVASCAIEYKKEGQVFGIGCKIFSIAGPVILYGLAMSSFLGLIYWISIKL